MVSLAPTLFLALLLQPVVDMAQMLTLEQADQGVLVEAGQIQTQAGLLLLEGLETHLLHLLLKAIMEALAQAQVQIMEQVAEGGLLLLAALRHQPDLEEMAGQAPHQPYLVLL